MEITSVKVAVKEVIDKIDTFVNNLPALEIKLDYNQRKNERLISDEWTKWNNLQGELSSTILASEYLQSNIKEAISVLNNNLEIEINQKNMLRKTIDILENRTKPLKDLKMSIQNFVYECQSMYRDSNR